jgi:deoxyribonuclease V
MIEYKYSITNIEVPYIPTFLAFREIPPMVSAINKLETKSEIYLIDAHGLIHPRGLGAASHIGVTLNIPTIGVAKSYLVGKIDDEGYIIYNNMRVGYKVNPNLYVSIGHRVSLESAIEIVNNVLKDMVPEPTKLAHIYAAKIKREMKF